MASFLEPLEDWMVDDSPCYQPSIALSGPMTLETELTIKYPGPGYDSNETIPTLSTAIQCDSIIINDENHVTLLFSAEYSAVSANIIRVPGTGPIDSPPPYSPASLSFYNTIWCSVRDASSTYFRVCHNANRRGGDWIWISTYGDYGSYNWYGNGVYVYKRYVRGTEPELPPGYEHDEERGLYVPTCLLIDGSNEIKCSTKNIYTISKRVFIPENLEIYISYTGSELVNNIDFVGETKILLNSDRNATSFSISTKENISGKIKITLTSSESKYVQCDDFIIDVTCSEDDSEDDSGDDSGDDSFANRNSCEDIGFFWEPYEHKTKLPKYML